MAVRVAVPREVATGETRVASIPEVTQRLAKRGLEVVVEAGAGTAGAAAGSPAAVVTPGEALPEDAPLR